MSAGVEMLTASAPAAASALERVERADTRVLRAQEARRSADVVTTPTNSHSGAEAISGAWKYLPPKP